MAKKKEVGTDCLPDMEGPNIICAHSDDDEKTLPNFIKRKHPRRGEKKKQGQKSRQANSPKKVGYKEEREPLRIVVIARVQKSHLLLFYS